MHFVEQLIRERATSGETVEMPRDLFDLLTKARDPETDKEFSPGQLRDQVATMILAGHETTAVSSVVGALSSCSRAGSSRPGGR